MKYRNLKPTFILSVLVCFLACGCSSSPIQSENPGKLASFSQKLEKKCINSNDGLDIIDTVVSPFNIKSNGPKYDLSLVDSNIREALLELSIMSSTPIVFDEGVSGTISVNISGKTFEEALDMITHAGPFDFKRSGSFYYVGLLDPQNSSWWKLLHTYHYRIRYQHPSAIHESLDPLQKKLVTIDDKKRVLSISAPRTMLLETLKSIVLLDRPQKQILLELTISELSQNARKNLGKILKSGTASDYTGYYPGAETENTAILGNLTYMNFIHSLQAFAQQGEADIKARPSLMVLEGNEAIFNSNQKYLLPTSRGHSSAKLRFIDTGVVLKITPYLGENNEIILKISESGSSNFSKTANDVQEQKISTTIIVKPGESVLFGGMMQERNRVQVTKVPILGDIPLVGYFFKSKEETSEIKEVIFAIRPQIVCRTRS